MTAIVTRQHIRFALTLLLAVACLSGRAQLNYYETTLNGGVTMGGWSPQVFGTGNGNFDVYIEPGSTVQAAFLVLGRLGPGDGTVTLDGTNYSLNASNEVVGNLTSLYGTPSGIHVIDVTADVDPGVTSHSIAFGTPYQDSQLVIFYSNPNLPPVNGALFINTFNLDQSTATWSLDFAVPISNTTDVGLAFFNSYQCDASFDGEDITVNGTFLGTLGTNDYNSGGCTGTLGNFYYQNNVLTGLGDDNADQAVSAGEALSNVSGLVSNGDTNISVLFEHAGGNADNHQWSVIAVYGASCNTPTSNFTAENVCIGENISFADASSVNTISWDWDFDDGTGSNDQNPIHNYSAPGVYDVTLVVTSDDGCTDTFTSQVEVFANPTINISVAGGCGGDPFTLTASGAADYVWNPGGSTDNPLDVNPAVSTTYDVTGTTAQGCSGTAQVTIDPVEPLSVVATWLTDATCANGNGGSATSVAAGGIAPYDFQWSPSGGNSADANGLAPGTYFVTVTDDAGCSEVSEEIVIILDGDIDVEITGTDTICIGESITLSAAGATTYEWSTGSAGSTLSLSPGSSEEYFVEGITGACVDTAFFSVTVNPLPDISDSQQYIIFFGESVTLEAGVDGYVVWSPGDALDCTECPNPIASPQVSTVYSMSVTDTETGCSATADVVVIVEFSDVFIPNAITVDNDDLNEVFRVYGGPFLNPKMEIFNRWGDLIFESDNFDTGWNGGANGYYVQDGVYLYRISYDTDEGRKERSGTVTVIR